MRRLRRLCSPLAPRSGERVGVRGNGLFNSLPASGAREQIYAPSPYPSPRKRGEGTNAVEERLATPSPQEMGNRGRRPRSPEGQRAGVRENGLIRPLTLTLSPQAGRGNKCTRKATCYPLAPCNGEPRPQAEIPGGSKGWGEGKWPHTAPHPIPLPAGGAREQCAGCGACVPPSPRAAGRGLG